MQKLILFVTFLTISLLSLAQTINPQPGLRLDMKADKKTIIERIISQKKDDAGNFKISSTGKPEMDTTLKEKTIVEYVDSRVALYGLTSLNSSNSDVLNSLNGTGRLGAVMNIGKKGGLVFNVGVNMLNANPPKGTSKDSVDFNSLMFPETGNFGFLFSPSVKLSPVKWGEHSLWLEGSFAYRKVSVDSPSVNFKALSYNIGLKYQWDYQLGGDSNRLIFTIMPYWNFFNIPNEEVTKFKTILNDPLFNKVSHGAEIYSIGVKTTLQYKNFIFFFDIRNNKNTKEFDDNNPLKGTKVNIGFVTAFSVKRF